ncbi:cullin-9 isoform X1 [Pygocentrus nattereri]|uniref:cullin-9 isoform X1 n=1 Tax=Pygocentrus nattereri TaxID=42514 RepID=UPI00081495EC|nr:cullin-9 isoform X1 [Pygocentrus nattereri]
MPRRATTKKTASIENTAVDGGGRAKRTCQSRVGKSRGKKNNTEETGMGTGKSSSVIVTYPPIQETITLLKCPDCAYPLKPVLDTAGIRMPLLQCLQCPVGQPLCEQCLYPCSNNPDKSTPTCTNSSCQLVSVLLTCAEVTDPSSRVMGCPLFRACPKCHSLMMHEGGCKYVACVNCQHRYCFICLESTKECRKDVGKYWLLTCSKPRAARQRFQT